MVSHTHKELPQGSWTVACTAPWTRLCSGPCHFKTSEGKMQKMSNFFFLPVFIKEVEAGEAPGRAVCPGHEGERCGHDCIWYCSNSKYCTKVASQISNNWRKKKCLNIDNNHFLSEKLRQVQNLCFMYHCHCMNHYYDFVLKWMRERLIISQLNHDMYSIIYTYLFFYM